MSIHNNNIFNAALAGASAGIASRWLKNPDSSSYVNQAALIEEFATAFDAAIAPLTSGGSRGQASIVLNICAAFWTNRVITPGTNLESAVIPLVALFDALDVELQPDTGGGGGGDVLSVFGRTGAVAAEEGDYTTSEIANDSNIPGTTAADALDTLGEASAPGPMPSMLFVAHGVASGGDGSAARPFDTLTAAIAAIPDGGAIMLAPGDYTDEGFPAWSDKRITFVGQTIYNVATLNDTKIQMAPNATQAMVVEIIGCNCHPSPTGPVPILFVIRNSIINAFGPTPANFVIMGDNVTGGLTCLGPGTIGSYTAIGTNVSNVPASASCSIQNGSVRGAMSFGPIGSGKSTWSSVDIQADTVDVSSQGLNLWGCYFNGPSTIFTGNIFTDLATYQRGVAAGVTWSSDTVIVGEGQPLQPVFVASGVGDAGPGTPVSPAYGTNAAGDVFTAIIADLAFGANPPPTPGGWTLRATITAGTVFQRLYTRNTVSTGGEVGSVTWNYGAGSGLTIGQIYTYRNVDVTSFVESVVTVSSTTGVTPGPTVTPTGQGRTAVVAYTSSEDAVAVPLTGEVGGIWQDRADFGTVLGAALNMQSAALQLTPISGGTGTFGSGTAAVTGIAFALIGLVP